MKTDSTGNLKKRLKVVEIGGAEDSFILKMQPMGFKGSVYDIIFNTESGV